jgi:hypothetical protein
MIIASAIKLKDGQIFLGKRHGDAIFAAHKILEVEHISFVDDGFLTSDLQFLSRKEALLYAKAHGQFKREEMQKKIGRRIYSYNGDELFSEDLW